MSKHTILWSGGGGYLLELSLMLYAVLSVFDSLSSLTKKGVVVPVKFSDRSNARNELFKTLM